MILCQFRDFLNQISWLVWPDISFLDRQFKSFYIVIFDESPLLVFIKYFNSLFRKHIR